MVKKRIQIQREIKNYKIEEYIIEANDDDYGIILEDIFRKNVEVEPDRIVKEWSKEGESCLLVEEDLNQTKGEQMDKKLQLELTTIGSDEKIIKATVAGEEVEYLSDILRAFVDVTYDDASIRWENTSAYLNIKGIDFLLPITTEYTGNDDYDEIREHPKDIFIKALQACIEEIKRTYQRESVIRTHTINLLDFS